MVETMPLGKCNAKSSNSAWIIDSGATAHMCNQRELFSEFLEIIPLNVTLGDGHSLQAMGSGKLNLLIKVSTGEQKCELHDVLYVPSLTFNLFSVSKASKGGKSVTFVNDKVEVKLPNGNLVATGKRQGSLYYLNTCHGQAATVNQYGHISTLCYHDVVFNEGTPILEGTLNSSNLTAGESDKLTEPVEPEKVDDVTLEPTCVLPQHDRCAPIEVIPTPTGYWIGQSGYVLRLLDCFGMADSMPVLTPEDTCSKTVPSDNPKSINKLVYQSAVGSLLYLSH